MPIVQVVGETADTLTLNIVDKHHSPAEVVSSFLDRVNTVDLIGDALSTHPEKTPADAVVAYLRQQAHEWEEAMTDEPTARH